MITLNDLEMTIEALLKNTQNELKKNNDKEMLTVIKELMKLNQIYCWKKPCALESSFADLLSKVEKIEGKEVDVFELQFL